MTNAELQARAQALASLEGWTDTPVLPDWAALVNRAWAEFSWDTECVFGQAIFPTVAEQAEYTIVNDDGDPGTTDPPIAFKYISRALYDSSGNPSRLSVMTEMDLDLENPLWLAAASGVPTRLVFLTSTTCRLYPTPATSAKNILLRGPRQGAAMTTDTESPAVPDVFQEAIALRAAWLHGKAYATGEAMQRLAIYQTEYDGYVRRCRRFLSGLRARDIARYTPDAPYDRISY